MKYLGSKSRIGAEIVDVILSRTKKTTGIWVEPFAGGLNLTTHIPDSFDRVCYDSNPYLVAMWQALLTGWTPPKEVTREKYYQVKLNKPHYPDYLVGWVGFNCSYCGKFFDGYAGKTKTKGGLRDYQEEAFNNINKQRSKLQGVSINLADYTEVVIPDGAIVYCDPPYANTTKYTSDFDSDTFWHWVRQVSQKAYVFVSEYQAPNDFESIWEKKLSSSLSANGKIGANKQSIERLFQLRS